MKTVRNFATSAALGLVVGLTGLPVVAATPDNMLVIANRIDDITTLDPAQSFEFAGSDVNRNIYSKLVGIDPADPLASFLIFSLKKELLKRPHR